mgnify:CR=1 FL=1|tara:strand:+ start:5068 stop:6600 length:1533 start_codon:yes stop_codon:yes gene_type:complete
MSKGGDTQTETSTKELDPDVKAAMMKLWEGGQSVLGNWIGEPAYRVAGFTPDQLYAQDATRFQLDNAQNNPLYRPQTLSAGGPMMAGFSGIPGANTAMFTGAGPMAQAGFTGAGPMTQAAFTGAGSMAQANATDAAGSRLSGNAYKEFMNPFIDSVIDPAISKMRRERDISLAGAGSRAASGAAYGGSRGALEKSQIERGHNEQVATLIPQLMMQGYDKATATAMANAQMAQQTSLANAQSRNSMATSNAQMFNQGALQDASQRNSMASNNAQMWNQGALQDATQRNAMSSNNAQMWNQGALQDSSQRNSMSTSNAQMMNAIMQRNAEMLNQMSSSNAQQGNAFNLQNTEMMNRFNSSNANDIWGREQAAIQALMQSGALQQMLAQKGLDIPIESLKLLAGFRPQSDAGTTTTTKPDNSPSPLAQVLGFALQAIPMFSDKDEKTNIQKLGKDPATGETQYAYDYKADVAKARKSGSPMPPKRVGPMAQEIEKTQPERVTKIGGKRVVRGI